MPAEREQFFNFQDSCRRIGGELYGTPEQLVCKVKPDIRIKLNMPSGVIYGSLIVEFGEEAKPARIGVTFEQKRVSVI